MKAEEFCALLREQAAAIEVAVDEAQARRMAEHFALVLSWNRRINLTRIVDPVVAVGQHYIDSLLVAGLLPAGARVLDLGSGAGFPGIPLAIVREDLFLTLAEAVLKKRIFLEQAVRKLSLAQVRVVGRMGDDPHIADRFDAVVTRAMGPLGRIAGIVGDALAPGGRILALKGPRVRAEMAGRDRVLERKGFCAEIVRETRLPGAGEERVIVGLSRIGVPQR